LDVQKCAGEKCSFATTYTWSRAQAYAAEMTAFVEMVRNGAAGQNAQFLCTAQDAYRAAVVADAARRSLESSQPISVLSL
jgi:predicted dehydrogenase